MFFLPPVKYRTSLSEVFCKKGVLKNFAKLTGKLLCRGLLFNKVTGLIAATLLKRRLQNRYFPKNFAKFYEQLFYRTAPVAASDHVENSSKVPLNLDFDDFFEN